MKNSIEYKHIAIWLKGYFECIMLTCRASEGIEYNMRLILQKRIDIFLYKIPSFQEDNENSEQLNLLRSDLSKEIKDREDSISQLQSFLGYLYDLGRPSYGEGSGTRNHVDWIDSILRTNYFFNEKYLHDLDEFFKMTDDDPRWEIMREMENDTMTVIGQAEEAAKISSSINEDNDVDWRALNDSELRSMDEESDGSWYWNID